MFDQIKECVGGAVFLRIAGGVWTLIEKKHGKKLLLLQWKQWVVSLLLL
jgi:hypothetical protein